MATISDVKSIHATLSTTTVDIAQLTQFWSTIEITNDDTSNILYVTFDGSTPVAAAEGTYMIPTDAAKVFGPEGIQLANGVPGSTSTPCHQVRVLGNGGVYHIEGS